MNTYITLLRGINVGGNNIIKRTMKQFLTIIFIFSIAIVSGQKQKNNLQFKRFNKNYTWQIATKEQIDSFYYNLMPIYRSHFQIHIRISLSGQIIDLFTNDNKKYDGFLTNITTEYADKKDEQGYKQLVKKRIVFEKIPLCEEKVKLLMDTLIAKQFEIPTDSLISGWNEGFITFDCTSFDFDYKVNGQIKTQSYHCPWSQRDTTAYKFIIIENYNLIKTVFNLDSAYCR